ncbi:MAG: hypothetical protein N2504_06650 [candidate division WOR-3 bacterium]|nr:hypothetical protein [candidate division WOR-3 bacterium]
MIFIVSLCNDTLSFEIPVITEGVIYRAFKVLNFLSLDEKISQIIWVYPPGVSYSKTYNVNGIVFNQNHIKSLDFKKVIEDYNKNNKFFIISSADQEGGSVNRLKNLEGCNNIPSPFELSTLSLDSIYKLTFAMGTTMRKVGVYVNLAPVLDYSDKDYALMNRMKRVFSKNYDSLKLIANAYIDGFRKAGILLIAKHFPGYGDTRWNSDVQLTYYENDSIRFYKDYELFKFFKDKLDGFMISSLIYKFIDSVPAVFSSKAVKLSRDIDPWKILITDDLWAPALREFIRKDYEKNFTDEDLEKIFKYAFLAGNDGLLILYPAKVPILYRTIKKIINEKPELVHRLDSSVIRNMLLKHKIYNYFIDSLYYSLFKTNRFVLISQGEYNCSKYTNEINTLRRFLIRNVFIEVENDFHNCGFIKELKESGFKVYAWIRKLDYNLIKKADEFFDGILLDSVYTKRDLKTLDAIYSGNFTKIKVDPKPLEVYRELKNIVKKELILMVFPNFTDMLSHHQNWIDWDIDKVFIIPSVFYYQFADYYKNLKNKNIIFPLLNPFDDEKFDSYNFYGIAYPSLTSLRCLDTNPKESMKIFNDISICKIE